ncbi:hypothetical protein CEXT_676621 [Caerostris extrusa]|uniref:Uncharacterized protein n=1 Tax=Caerostris extrusa TaxID=172846 RepID=A0AAV4Y6G5_CAEEX|nr:hypothetical protein CEXT_676621 [Caerostris extrusa]
MASSLATVSHRQKLFERRCKTSIPLIICTTLCEIWRYWKPERITAVMVSMRSWDLIKLRAFHSAGLFKREEFHSGVCGRKVEWLLLLQQSPIDKSYWGAS